MTRLELLTILVGRARANGFEFRRWYTGRLGLPWISAEAALTLLEQQRRYYALIFSHEFALCFWKAGAEITFSVPQQTYQRRMSDGSIATITRKAFQRRSARPNAWLYHLREMAAAEEPLRYLRRYLNVEDNLTDESDTDPEAAPASPAIKSSHVRKRGRAASPKPGGRPIPTDTPAFLRRPYP
jgi:hypothetical protein